METHDRCAEQNAEVLEMHAHGIHYKLKALGENYEWLFAEEEIQRLSAHVLEVVRTLLELRNDYAKLRERCKELKRRTIGQAEECMNKMRRIQRGSLLEARRANGDRE